MVAGRNTSPACTRAAHHALASSFPSTAIPDEPMRFAMGFP